MLLLTRSDVRKLLKLSDCITAVERAFAAHARGESLAPVLTHVDAPKGEFHIKAGGLRFGDRTYFALKSNGGFFGNPVMGLPAIQGVIFLADADNGTPLAVLDSAEITAIRTGAATAVAAKYLARSDSSILTICGCGRQGRVQLRALMECLPIRRAYAWSRRPDRAIAFAQEMSADLKIEVIAAPRLENCTTLSDVIVTCTSAKGPFLRNEHVRPGTFIAAVGADSPSKQELDPSLVAASALITDLTAQAAECGELHHAIKAGLLTVAGIRGELGEVIIANKPGRRSANEITLFDSTGTALQDAAAAVMVYLHATEKKVGATIDLPQ